MPDHRPPLPAGHRLKQYRIERELGSGGFAITYYAIDTDSNKPVAIKEYLPEQFALRIDTNTVRPKSPADQDQYQQCLDRFCSEALALARFKNPHINKVKDLILANDTAYIVLEYIEGKTLSQVLRRDNRLDAPRLRRLLDELLSGLEAVHGEGLVHRDIKPDNIMLRPDGSAILLDFGAARQTVEQNSERISTRIYTPGYGAVEQDGGKVKDLGPWTDLYALGRVAYRCITGLGENAIPEAKTRKQLKDAGKPDLAPAVEAGKGRYDESLLQAVDWAFRVNQDQRPHSVAELREVLEESKKKSWRTNINPKLIGILTLCHIAVIMLLYATSLFDDDEQFLFLAIFFVFPLGNIASALTVRLSNQHNARIIAVIAAIITVGIAWYLEDIHRYFSSSYLDKDIIAFCITYLPGQLLTITVFQKIRERTTRWWPPPMIATLFANTIQCSIFLFLVEAPLYVLLVVSVVMNIISIVMLLLAYGILHRIERKQGRPAALHRDTASKKNS